MRLGSMPSYLAFWECSGMRRMDEWEAHFRSPQAHEDRAERATHAAIHLQRGGCYDVIARGPKAKPDRLFAIEYFAADPAEHANTLARHFKARAKARPEAGLCFLLRRIGLLGPPPGCLAVWSFVDYEALEAFERGRRADDHFLPDEVGVYRWFGREVL